MAKRSPLLSISLRNGVVAGLLACGLFIAMYYIGHHPFLVSPFLDFRILLFGIFIFFTLKEFRDYHQRGLLYFWQGLIGSVLVVATASALAALGLWIFGNLEAGFVTSYVKGMTEYLKTFSEEDIQRIGKDIYERNLTMLPATNITALVETYLAQGFVIGFFVSIILSVILRRIT
jgi:hypothetical protein